MGFCYAGTETGDTKVGGWYCGGGGSGGGGGRQKTTTRGVGHRTAGREGGLGPIRKIRNDKRRSLGMEWSMSEVGNPPPHNLDKPHGLVASINNNNNNNKTVFIGLFLSLTTIGKLLIVLKVEKTQIIRHWNKFSYKIEWHQEHWFKHWQRYKWQRLWINFNNWQKFRKWILSC